MKFRYRCVLPLTLAAVVSAQTPQVPSTSDIPKPPSAPSVPNAPSAPQAPGVPNAPTASVPGVKVPDVKTPTVKTPEAKAPKVKKPKFGFGGAPDVGKLKMAAVGIPTGSPVSLTMKDKTKMTGKIGAVNNDGFDLQTVENGNIVNKAVGFDQLAKLSAGAPKSKLKSLGGPVLTVMSLLGTAGAITAAIRK